MKGWLVFGAVELVAALIGAALCYFGLIVWYLVPLFLFVPPVVIFVVVLVGGLLRAEANGENPFQ